MKNCIMLLLFITFFLSGCSNEKRKYSDEKSIERLEGMWKLKSGVWENKDGSFLKYPEDSITEGLAYIIYSEKHYMLIANAPKMNYYRGELMEYTINGDKLIVTNKLSNIDEFKGMKSEWTFKIENNILSAENGVNKEVWERIE